MTRRIGVFPYSKSNTEAIGGPHGGLGPAPIGTLDPRKLSFDKKCCGTLPESFVQVLDDIFMFLLIQILYKIDNESEVSIPI